MQVVEYNFVEPTDYTYPADITVENGVARLTAPYVTSDPSIRNAAALNIDMLIKLDVRYWFAAKDNILFTVEIDGVEYWWDGSAWSQSSGYSQANTPEDITAYAQFLEILNHTKTFRIVAYLHSYDGTRTPTLNYMAVTVGTFSETVTEPSKTKVWGFIRDLNGFPVEGVKIKAWLKRPVIYGKLIITPQVIEAKSYENGYFEILLVDNEGMKYFPDAGIGKPYYVFQFRGQGIKFTEYRYVPQAIAKEYITLEKIVGGADEEVNS